MEILRIENLTFYYPNSDIPAIDNVSVSIDSGDFFVLFGHSGSGKSTLLRHLKPQVTPHGVKHGRIRFCNNSIDSLSEYDSASKIGFVMQSPDNQIVTDKVWHELAFGLESLGYDMQTIRRRVAETASFFGIQNWFYKDISELSGGQKQLLNLASVMVMQPSLLILDEPTSQLDPIAASDFLAALKKINTELGTAVVITEHRLEEVLPLADKAAVMENGKMLCCGTVEEIGRYLKDNNSRMFLAMPAAARIWGSVHTELPCPVSVNEGRTFLKEYSEANDIKSIDVKPSKTFHNVKVSVEHVWFKYGRNLPDVLKDVNLTAHSGELFCILGGNGTGKTTLLRLIAGFCNPLSGEVKTYGKVCFLPQNPQTLFIKKTVYADLADALNEQKLSEEQVKDRIGSVIKLCRLNGLENRHPFDLSGGEQQRTALAKLLLLKPEILLLDEPTKGFDAVFKEEFADILRELLNAGVCIIMVSHDIEFCAEHADTCALFFDGNIAAGGSPQEFFSGNSFYTTSANRIARDMIPNAVTADDVIEAVGGEKLHVSKSSDTHYIVEAESNFCKTVKAKKFPVWRKIGAGISALLAFIIYLFAAKTDISDFSGITDLEIKQIVVYGLFIAFLILTAVFMGKNNKSIPIQMPKEKRKLSKRTIFSVVLILLFIPLTLFIGVFYIDIKQYYLVAFAVLLECMLPFFVIFEGRRPKARELTIIAVLCALGIAGRAAFFMFPQFKPVLALTIIAGVAFGGETGFLVGAITMLVSNIMFSQGPWTPWQMFAMGIIGFFAGVLYKTGFLRRSRISLCIFGVISAIVIYGGIINPSSALIWGNEALNWNIILSCYATGFTMDCIHAIATAIILWFISEPMLEKLDRVKTKYGLLD
ncbi:MAG: ATP-binding cassette domain-containing protein [Eubacterium sp.]|nr:ATP-binding cassette domain-containing protein [Eubacterium sp.]